MMRAGLDQAALLEAAAAIADRDGLKMVTAKALAERPSIKSPSLYNHFPGGIEESRQALMLYGWQNLQEAMVMAAVGKSGDEAILSICHTYRLYAKNHPGVFDAMQWYNIYDSDLNLQATQKLISVIFKVLDAYSLTESQKVHFVRSIRAFLQGFASIEIHGGYGNPERLEDSFYFAIHAILNGIKTESEES